MTVSKMLPLFAMTCLAGCMGGDSGGGGGGGMTPVSVMSFAELNLANTSIVDKISAAGPTEAGDIPTTGEMTYTGALTLLLQDGSNDGVIGAAEVTANFVSDEITGKADSFYDLDGNPTAGQVAIENGTLVRILGIVAGDINGAVTFKSGEMDVATGLAGNFSGDNAEFVSGVMTGTATPQSGPAVLVDGAVFAEQ